MGKLNAFNAPNVPKTNLPRSSSFGGFGRTTPFDSGSAMNSASFARMNFDPVPVNLREFDPLPRRTSLLKGDARSKSSASVLADKDLEELLQGYGGGSKSGVSSQEFLDQMFPDSSIESRSLRSSGTDEFGFKDTDPRNRPEFLRWKEATFGMPKKGRTTQSLDTLVGNKAAIEADVSATMKQADSKMKRSSSALEDLDYDIQPGKVSRLKRMYEGFRNRLTGVGETVEEGVEKGKQKFKETSDKAAAKSKEGIDKAAEKAKELTGGALDSSIDALKADLNKKVDELNETLQETADRVPKKLWKKKTVYLAATPLAGLASFISSAVASAEDNELTGKLEELSVKLKTMADNLTKFFNGDENTEGSFAYFVKQMKGAIDLLKQAIKDLEDDLEGIGTTLQSILEKFQNILNSVNTGGGGETNTGDGGGRAS